jgi:glycosyltransferase involved in cell wall biosynthesis
MPSPPSPIPPASRGLRPPPLAIVSDERFPSHHTDTEQVVKTAAALARAGVDVLLVVPRRWRTWRLSPGERRCRVAQAYHLDAAPPLCEVFGPPSSLRSLVKPFHALAGVLAARRRGRELIVTRNLGAALVALALDCRVWFDTYKPLPDQHPLWARVFRRLARHPGFAGITTHSAFARDAFVRAGVPAERVHPVLNGHEPRDLEPRVPRAEARSRLGWPPGAFIAVYAGHCRAGKGLGLVIDGAAQVGGLELAFVGARPAEAEWLLARSRAAGLRCRCDGWLAAPELALRLHAADVLVVPPASAPLRTIGDTVLPMKLFLYLAAGRPIVAPRLPDCAELLADGHNALLVPPDDPAALAAALVRLRDDAALAERLATAARADAAALTWDARAERLAALFADADGPR